MLSVMDVTAIVCAAEKLVGEAIAVLKRFGPFVAAVLV